MSDARVHEPQLVSDEQVGTRRDILSQVAMVRRRHRSRIDGGVRLAC